jgi:CCR4-NOT transcription complex subunit 3
VKNKTPLLEARKTIERRMEAFKVVERETKTKAYSKEGLARDQPLSAEERKRLRTREWVQDVVQKLSDQIDEYEAESEAAGGGRSKKEREALAALETVIRNHRFHVDKLEAVRARGTSRPRRRRSLDLVDVNRVTEG